MKRQLKHASFGERLARLAILLLFTVSFAPHVCAQEGDFEPNGRRVSVLFTAMGKDKKLITSLKAEDIRVSADGVPCNVLYFKRQSDLPVFIAVVVDTSASQETVLPKAKVAAFVFVRGMIVPGVDKAAVVSFARDTTLEQEMTDDLTKLHDAIARLKFVNPLSDPGALTGNNPAETGIWDAVWVASRDVMSRSLGTGRRVMLLVTDGVDTSSRVKLSEAVESALQSEVVVYAVGFGDKKNYDGVDKSPLRKLAEQTGGRAFFPKKVEDLTEIFTEISEELRSQYVVTFAPAFVARDGSLHKLRIEVVNHGLREQGVELAYPQGYYAGNAPTAIKK
jgi:Ca-activated chloride channel homolog